MRHTRQRQTTNPRLEDKQMTKHQMRQAFLEMSRIYGRKAKGVPKTMSKAAIEQRKAAGKASSDARILREQQQTKKEKQQ